MTDRPIIFSGPMVRALLDGRKTMTRRLAHLPPRVFMKIGDGPVEPILAPSNWRKVAPGDRLWVRESIKIVGSFLDYSNGERRQCAARDEYFWAVNYRREKVPAIHMPRWASRITLEVTAVKVERLAQISEEDALAEGIVREFARAPFLTFADLWDSLHGKDAFLANPEVVAISFNVWLYNIDRPAAALLARASL